MTDKEFQKYEQANSEWLKFSETAGEKIYWLSQFDGDEDKAKWAFIKFQTESNDLSNESDIGDKDGTVPQGMVSLDPVVSVPVGMYDLGTAKKSSHKPKTYVQGSKSFLQKLRDGKISLIAIWLIGIWFPNVVFTFVNNAIHPRSAFAKSLSGFAPTLLATTLIIVQTYALVLFYIGFMAKYRNKNNTWLFWAASLFGLLGLIGLMLGFFGIMEMWANVLSPPPSSNGWGSSGWK